jgi:tRNA-2-methylthio-N6-dimethylallyladenosine synthase
VENKARKDDNMFGKTENMRNTHFKGNESLIGQIVSVKITAARGNSLVGELTS